MATRMKTVEYWFPMTTLNDATDTDLTQITVYLPESSKVFKSVFMEVVAHDRNTTIANISRHQVSLRLGSAGYTVINNANAITNGGEQQTILFSGDFTSHFVSNWSGTSMTCDGRVLMDSAAASPLSPSFNNVSVRLVITYEYDGDSSTHIKTVRIPLDMPVTAMGTSQPGSAVATIPALDTELPEASKTYRQRVVVVQGNDNNTGTTDQSFSVLIEGGTTFTSDVYEHGSTVSMFERFHTIQSFTTNATHGFYIWSNVAMGHHMQAWLVVTYEFDATSSNDVFVSLMLPADIDSPMGGTTSSDYQRGLCNLWIQEQNVTKKQIACYLFWDQLGTIGGFNMRIGTGSFVTYTDVAAVLGGANAAMIRNDGAFTLSRGKNTFNFDIYRTDATDIGYNINAFFIVNYTCSKPSGGHGQENHTISWMLSDTGTAAVAVHNIISAKSVTLPESNYFINNTGLYLAYIPSGTVAVAGAAVQVERLSGEGGLKWERIYSDVAGTDGETGIYHVCAGANVFKRWAGDPSSRLDIQSSRRYRWAAGNSVSARGSLFAMITYHSITYSISGAISGSAGGTVNLELIDNSTKEILVTGSRTGNGSYTLTWYDNTVDVYVSAYEDGSHVGRSSIGTGT